MDISAPLAGEYHKAGAAQTARARRDAEAERVRVAKLVGMDEAAKAGSYTMFELGQQVVRAQCRL